MRGIKSHLMTALVYCRRTEKYIKTLETAEPESVSMKIALNIGRMPGLGKSSLPILYTHLKITFSFSKTIASIYHLLETREYE